MTTDAVDEAIAAAPDTQRSREITARLTTGRFALVQVPVDATDGELLELVAIVAGEVRALVVKERAAVRRPSLLVTGR